MDYTKFLGKKDELVLPYLGGAHVHAKDRRLRVDDPRPAIGFHRFEVRGRNARALEPSEAEFHDAPKLRGHLVAGWLCHANGVDHLELMPEEEHAPLCTARGRRWYSGVPIFESLDFDAEAEEEARLRLERREPLGDLKGVHLTLRVAFGIAFVLATGRRNEIPVSVREALPIASAVANEGAAPATALLARLRDERERAATQNLLARIARGERVPLPERRRVGNVAPTVENAALRAEAALESADATMTASRSLGNGNLEVTFRFRGERFISVVDAITLQVFDAGVCLAGEDRLVTLDSLPSVIREAIDTSRLVITRR